MPSKDRYWPVALAVIIIYTAAIVGGVVWFLVTTLPLDNALGISPWSELTCDNLYFAILMAIFVPSFFVWCFHARTRMRLRERALAGDLDAIPASRIVPHPEDAPDVAAGPLILAWRPLTSSAGMVLLFVLILIAMFVLIPLGALGLFLALKYFGVRSMQIALAATLSLMAAGVVGGLLLLYKIARHKRASKLAVRLTASRDGLRWERGAEAREIPWYEACLLEVWLGTGSRGGKRWAAYRLYGRNTWIEWSELPANLIMAEEMGYDELVRRQHLLLDLIATKSRLTPRTFAKRLQAPASPVQTHGALSRALLLGYGFVVVIAAALVGLAAAILILPQTGIPPLNDASAVALCLVAGYLVWLVIQETTEGKREGCSRATFAEGSILASATPHSLPVGFRYTASVGRRIKLGTCGILLAGMGIPAALTLSATTHSSGTDVPIFEMDPRALVADALVVCAFVGVILLAIAVIVRPTTILLDDAGLHAQERRTPQFLSWNDIAVVRVTRDGSQASSFAVESSTTTISFPGSWAKQLPPADGAAFVSPEQLAALIAAKSGCLVTYA